MKSGFTLIWSFRNRLEILKRSITTADKTTPKEVNFCLIDAASDEETIRELRIFCNSIQDRKIRICESAQRSSLSEAWNQGIMLSDTENVIFVSSDVEFLREEWFFALRDAMNVGLQYCLLQNHAVFSISKKILPIMGWFDEGFQIGAHFDSDFMLRSTEHNIKFGIIPNTDESFYKHGHDDIKIEKERNTKEFQDRLPTNNKFNEQYFIKKWGCEKIWNGWSEWQHPPVSIHQSGVKRQFPEIDPHPQWTKKFL